MSSSSPSQQQQQQQQQNAHRDLPNHVAMGMSSPLRHELANDPTRSSTLARQQLFTLEHDLKNADEARYKLGARELDVRVCERLVVLVVFVPELTLAHKPQTKLEEVRRKNQELRMRLRSVMPQPLLPQSRSLKPSHTTDGLLL